MFRRKPPQNPPSVLIVGLGNPGQQYDGTRHNVGFAVIDVLAQRHRIKLDQFRDRARFGIGDIAGVQVALAKPTTYMNLSGQAVRALARRWNLRPEFVLVIADDLDIDVGRVKMVRSGSSGGHNGHKSIIASLGSQDYPRIKIGIGKSGETIDHVLSRFDRDEKPAIDACIEKAAKGVEALLADGLEAAMMLVNTS